jgi:hypothetical protein
MPKMLRKPGCWPLTIVRRLNRPNPYRRLADIALHGDVECPRTFYTDLSGLMCKALEQSHMQNWLLTKVTLVREGHL